MWLTTPSRGRRDTKPPTHRTRGPTARMTHKKLGKYPATMHSEGQVSPHVTLSPCLCVHNCVHVMSLLTSIQPNIFMSNAMVCPHS